jgi:hypothetical protein
MIRKSISNSKGVASLSPKALSLFAMLIPHFSSYGKMNGDPMYIKAEVVPLIPWFTVSNIKTALDEISKHTSVKWFEHDGRLYLHALSWFQHQDLRHDRLGGDHLPSHPDANLKSEVRDYSRTTPGSVRPEVEVEVEVNEKKKENLNLKSSATPSPASPSPLGGAVDDVSDSTPDALVDEKTFKTALAQLIESIPPGQ